MKLYKHKDYNEYYKAQLAKNVNKLKTVYIKEKEIILLSKHIKENIPDLKFGICHGVRNGWEVQRLRKLLNIEIIGTEISPTANKFKNVIQWDFHKVKDGWINNVDFIYSNSFDHAINPTECLKTWMSCLKATGCCIIEWTPKHTESYANITDPFGASLKEYEELITKCGFKIKQQLKYKPINSKYCKFYFVIIKP